MALRLHAVTISDPRHPNSPLDRHRGSWAPPVLPPTVSLIPFRDLCAVVSEQKAFVLDERGPEAVVEQRTVVDAVFQNGPVLPAPVGVVFRAPDVLKRWMELHYVSLSDALEFVEDRAGARVHIQRADGKADELETGSDLAAAATEALRALRRRSVASLPLRLEEVTGLTLSAAFLVDKDSWKDFVSGVDEQRDVHHRLRFDVTGPWAPYDFVRMQFGA